MGTCVPQLDIGYGRIVGGQTESVRNNQSNRDQQMLV